MATADLETSERGRIVHSHLSEIPGILFVDHVAIAVRQGELDGQVKAYEMLGFREIHREEVLGADQVREALLQIGSGPNLIQLLEPLNADSPVQKTIEMPVPSSRLIPSTTRFTASSPGGGPSLRCSWVDAISASSPAAVPPSNLATRTHM